MSNNKTPKKVVKTKFDLLVENVLGASFGDAALDAPADDADDTGLDTGADEGFADEAPGDDVTLTIPREQLQALKALIDAALGDEALADEGDEFGDETEGAEGDADFDIEDAAVTDEDEEEVTDEDEEEVTDEDEEEAEPTMNESTAAKKLPEKKAINAFKQPKVKGKLATASKGKAKVAAGKKTDGKLEKAPVGAEKKFKSGKVEGAKTSRVGKTLFDK